MFSILFLPKSWLTAKPDHLKGNTPDYFANFVTTWRITPVSKELVTPINKPFRPFGRGPTTPLRGLTISPWLLTTYPSPGMILQEDKSWVCDMFPSLSPIRMPHSSCQPRVLLPLFTFYHVRESPPNCGDCQESPTEMP